MSKVDVIIPARLDSHRLPNKVLLDMGGKPMIQRVYESAEVAFGSFINCVYIAVDSQKLFDECVKFTNNVILTSNQHKNGTSRIIEALKTTNSDFVINVQGDEPFVTNDIIQKVAYKLLERESQIVSAYSLIKNYEDFINQNLVKVVIDKSSNALYFSREPIPHYVNEIDFHKAPPKKHYGIYGYSADFLNQLKDMDELTLSNIESLEQLKFLENGFKIKMIEIESFHKGIDTIDDYNLALEYLKLNK
jgi:3-deoxy-manno-octulosonate cytidylyltransferase (CMP-KDO synthetase)